MNVNDYLSKQLKEARIERNLKQSDVTKLTGIKNSTLSNYENGITAPDVDSFMRLCRIYNLDYAEVLGTAYSYKSASIDFILNKTEKEIVNKYRELDVTGKETVDYILDKQHERVSHHDWLLSAVSEAIEEEELDIPTPHPYHGVDEDKVREVIERNTAKYLGKLSSELRILQHNKDMNDIKKGDD